MENQSFSIIHAYMLMPWHPRIGTNYWSTYLDKVMEISFKMGTFLEISLPLRLSVRPPCFRPQLLRLPEYFMTKVWSPALEGVLVYCHQLPSKHSLKDAIYRVFLIYFLKVNSQPQLNGQFLTTIIGWRGRKFSKRILNFVWKILYIFVQIINSYARTNLHQTLYRIELIKLID